MAVITSDTLHGATYQKAAVDEFVAKYPQYHAAMNGSMPIAVSPQRSVLPGYYLQANWPALAAGKPAPPISIDASGVAYIDWNSFQTQVAIANANLEASHPKGPLGAVSSVSQTVYQLGDALVFGALPNDLAGYHISGTQGGTDADTTLGRVPANATAGLPDAGKNVGDTAKNLVDPAIDEAKKAADAASKTITKVLLVAGLVVAAILVILLAGTSGRSVNAGPVGIGA